MKLIFL